MSALLVEEISSERDAQRADFQQERIQLCGSSEPFKVHRVTVLVARVAKGTLSNSCIPKNEEEDFRPAGGVLYLSVGSLVSPTPTEFTPDTRKR